MMRRWLLLLPLMLAACQSSTENAENPPARRTYTSQNAKAYAEQQFAVYDPLEATNKNLYKFNAKLDKYVLLPVVDTYTALTPEPVRHGVTNFFANVGEFENFTNALLQTDLRKANITLWRFITNTPAGLLGTMDVASDWGLPRQPEDFGQTLGYWGVGPGPYIIVPALGPSNLRDFAGRIVDGFMLSYAMPDKVENTTAYNATMYGLRIIDMRANIDFRYYGTGSPFEYELVRYITSEARALQVGN